MINIATGIQYVWKFYFVSIVNAMDMNLKVTEVLNNYDHAAMTRL